MPSRRTPVGRDQDDDYIEEAAKCSFLYMVCIFFWYWRYLGANAIQLCTISMCHFTAVYVIRSVMVLVWLEKEREKKFDARTRSSRSRSGLTDLLLSDLWTILLLISAWVVVALLLQATMEFNKMWAAASPNSFTAVKYVLGLVLTLWFLMPTSFWRAFRFRYPRRRDKPYVACAGFIVALGVAEMTLPLLWTGMSLNQWLVIFVTVTLLFLLEWLRRRPNQNDEALHALAIRDNRTAALKRSCAICDRGGPPDNEHAFLWDGSARRVSISVASESKCYNLKMTTYCTTPQKSRSRGRL